MDPVTPMRVVILIAARKPGFLKMDMKTIVGVLDMMNEIRMKVTTFSSNTLIYGAYLRYR